MKPTLLPADSGTPSFRFTLFPLSEEFLNREVISGGLQRAKLVMAEFWCFYDRAEGEQTSATKAWARQRIPGPNSKGRKEGQRAERHRLALGKVTWNENFESICILKLTKCQGMPLPRSLSKHSLAWNIMKCKGKEMRKREECDLPIVV